ncbi:phosphodiester glycosidase family protein [Cyanobacterium sp. uoEpiScrs1]|uniref:phosphodiester glycosidase family protein n=1 Tax=Cyanobacterium sp. uoEpiScrs1 TaxID=2976343 RepID=UPI00226AE012|nr:phosphodiester glycosidase family protein [Cyanobacterium sp. uoEpiScrs1]
MRQVQLNSLSLYCLSLVSALLIHWLISGEYDKITQHIFFPKPLPVEASDGPQQGNEIYLNGKLFNIPWSKWSRGNSQRIGISDTGVMNLLGIELLSTNKPTLQPIRWFSTDSSQSFSITARFIEPYRYLDVTDLIESVQGTLQVKDNLLEITLPPARISGIREGNQIWGKRIVVDVDRPTVWQVSQAKGKGVVTISAHTNVFSSDQMSTGLSPISETWDDPDEDDLGSNISRPITSQLFSLEKNGQITKVHINLPTSHGLNVFSIANPYRIVIDVRPDARVPKQISWTKDIIWRQQLVKLRKNIFPVNWLEINARSSQISLKPITTYPNRQEGTAPLVTIAKEWKASAAINGGFFNRNNKLPLGAIRSQARWLSSPILGRGVIAWNNQGQIKIGRLSFQETLVTSKGQRIPILFLNSGYVQAGMARYTPEWGPKYVPMSDNETIIFIQNGRVIDQKKANEVGKNPFSIPANGYLLIIRNSTISAAALQLGTKVQIENTTAPTDFKTYPNILGAGPVLISNNHIVVDGALERFSKGFQQQKASRSAIGVTNQGKIMLVAVHNRVRGRGASLREMAEIMQQLGAVNALNLDGGSSTSLSLGGQLIDRSPITAARVHNGIGVFVNP